MKTLDDIKKKLVGNLTSNMADFSIAAKQSPSKAVKAMSKIYEDIDKDIDNAFGETYKAIRLDKHHYKGSMAMGANAEEMLMKHKSWVMGYNQALADLDKRAKKFGIKL